MKTDLNYLRTMSGDNEELIKEMIEIFIHQVKEIESEFREHFDNKNYDQLGKLAHKAKSSVAIMGMDNLAEKLKELELLTKKNEQTESYKVYIDTFRTETEEAIKELKEYKKSLD